MTVDNEKIVQNQVDAYNARDVEQFLSYYADDVAVYEFPDTLLLRGRQEMQERYGERFRSSPDLCAKITKRLTTHRYVVDYETLSGSAFEPHSAVVIYEVNDQLITRVWFVRESTI